MDTFGKQSLDAHNEFRGKHKTPPMAWSPEIAKGAQAWADKLAQSGTLKHASKDDRGGDGENVYMCFGKDDITGKDVVEQWYSEIKKYNFKKGGFQSGTGHFTQVVWKESKQFGIGKAKTSDGKIFVVGRYRPAGNMLNAFSDNVLPA